MQHTLSETVSPNRRGIGRIVPSYAAVKTWKVITNTQMESYASEFICSAHKCERRGVSSQQGLNPGGSRASRTCCATAVLILNPIFENMAAMAVPAVPKELISISISVASSAAAPPASYLRRLSVSLCHRQNPACGQEPPDTSGANNQHTGLSNDELAPQ